MAPRSPPGLLTSTPASNPISASAILEQLQRLRSAAMGEIWKAVVGLLVTGGPLLAVQLGGRRGLMRRAIREERELLGLLDDADHAAVRERLHRRVTTRLEQYEPQAQP